MLDQHWIAAYIPHQGSMCLLEQVIRWDEEQIVCQAISHQLESNPLRAEAQLGAANLIEYAAQAMAIHGALLSSESQAPKSGYLTCVRNIEWHRQRIDDLPGPLTIHATRLSGNPVMVMYQFEVHAGQQLLASGRASAVLDAARV